MKAIRKLKLLLVLILLGWANVSQAHVYWKPNSGNDSNDGSTAAKAVKTWTRAKALLSNQSNDAQIYLCERLTISSTTTMDGAISGKANARVRRNMTDFMFHVSSASATLTLKNITITGEMVSSNPHWDDTKSIIATSGVVVLDNGTILKDNYVTDDSEPFAGAVRIYNGGTFTMKTGSRISGCKAEREGSTVTYEGGAIMSGANCTVNIEGGIIENCTSSHIGGAICLRSGTYTFNMSGGTIKGCSAAKGGGVYLAPILKTDGTYSNVNATINMTGGTIQNCRATNNCGGAYMLGTDTGLITMNLNGGTIDTCVAVNGYGGAIGFNRGRLALNMNGGTISRCNAYYGGGICFYPVTENGVESQVKVTMNMTGGLIENCIASRTTGYSSYGGGIYMSCNVENSTLTMTGGKIRNCKAHVYGGGICANGEETHVILTKGEIYECIADDEITGNTNGSGRGGGVAVYNNTILDINGNEMLIHDNECAHYGGGVHAMSSAVVNYSAGKVYNNLAGYIEEERVPSGAAGLHITAATLHMSGGEVYNNRTRGVGGGIHASYEGTMVITGGLFHDNIAEWQGGGINLNTQCHLTFPKGSTVKFYDNEAGIGGAILLDGANLFIYDGEFYGNKALGTYPTNIFDSGTGGAFCLVMDRADQHHNDSVFPANFYMYGGDVHDNYASTHGGGLFVSKNTEHPLMGVSHITIKGGEMHENEANTGSGGGIYADAGCIFLMSADTVMNGSTISEINTPSIYENTAAQSGGGVYLTDAKFTIEAGAFLNNTAEQEGGGFYIAGDTAQVVIRGGEIKFNKAEQNGGGFAVFGGDVDISQANTTYPTMIASDTAYLDGGGMYVSGGLVTVSGGTINNNVAHQDGGGFYVDVSNTTDITTIKGGALVSSNTAVNGGGAYVNKGQLVIQDAATNINNNTASTSGGGIYMANGTVTFTNAKMQSNTATANDGGGLYLGNGTMTVSGTDATFSGNNAKSRGGGVYVGGGSFTMSGGTLGGTTANGNKTTGNTSYGGGLYMGGGTATISGGTISGNQTDSQGQGGGIYMNGGTCTLSNGAVIGGVPSGTLSYANSAKYGGGIYSKGGTITVKGGKIQYNTASTAGGGIYTNDAAGVVNMEKQNSKAEMLSYIEYNTAEEGGGIYANRGVVNFSDGFIQYNHASNAGGGIYVNDNGGDDYGTLYLKGSANLRRNNVPTGHNGGGVYLKGKVVVGEQTANLGVIKAQENFAGDEYVYEWNDTGHPETDSIDQVTANNRNNIYLPNPGDPSVLTNHRDVITVIENGISLQSNVGFSVPHNYVPVIYCAPSSTSQDYLDQFSTGHEYQYMVFDDTRHYVAVHYPDRPDIFDRDHVYLYGFWANVVTGNEFDLECPITAADFEGQDPIEISDACELAFFISWVNGLNGLDAHADANAILLADIDMSKYGWVPIGDLTNGYSGTFDGNGHTVTGISSLLYREYLDYGFFGRLNGGTVKDLFVKDASYALDNMPNLVIGGLVGYINTASTVENCEVSSRITATNTTTVVGGLIGRMNAGTVHSTIGISDMKGYLLGGLVGELLGGSLYNSFSNCKYTKAENHDKYMGGLAAVNRGTVENCYARLRGSAPTGNFGILVGDNTGGVVNYCYAPAGMTNYKAAGANPTGHGNYGDSFLPYLYGHRDTQVSLANSSNGYVPSYDGDDKQMMVALNNWVDANSTASVTYTTWGRPWHESDAVKPLNDDYPILRMPMAEAVGAKVGDPYLYYNPVDSLLVRYTDAESAIWLYRNPADVVRGDNSGSSAKLYIAEDVALKNLNELKAYVGITLDNSAGINGANPQGGVATGQQLTDATDWHMISSPLMDAPIGINYSDGVEYPFSWGHPEGMPYYLFYPKGDARHGYFPSHRFGESYPTTDATLQPGNYYVEWDFYSYYEPEYHWINFKRNSASHWHMDDLEHDDWHIFYGNEPSLVPGKGYFAATREETFLQCQGNLNADEVTIGLTHTPNIPRHGYNLIGNPYQAYLDFDAFAEYNSDDVDAIWGDVATASYTILDEDAAGYLTFAYDGSNNPDAAGRFIHPHQGFFVRAESGASTAYFQPDMRNTTAQNSTFRSNGHIDYPLVNLFVSEANGNSDMVTVELGRPTQGGAVLMQGLRAGNGKIWCHYNDVDYAVAYTQPGVTEAAIRFETVADTEYTMRWNTHNGDFSYLHLIDNLTGADVDCLTTDEYKFSASTSDYKSRFRLVFGYTGIEEPEAEANEKFAFIMNDALVVTGEGVLQVFDMTGRMVMSQELHGVQTRVSLPNAANGVYVLRLTEGKQSRVQKMVISK